MRRLIVLILVVVTTAVAAAQNGGWEADTGGIVYSTALSRDGSFQLVGSRNDRVAAYRSDGTLLWTFAPESTVWGVATSDDGQWNAVASEDRHLYLLDGQGQEVWRFRSQFIFTDVAMTPDGAHIAASDEGRKLYFFKRDSNDPLWTYDLENIADAVAMYAADSSRVLVGTRDSRVILFDAEGKPLWDTQLTNQVVNLAASRDGAKIVAGSMDAKVWLLDGANGDTRWQIAMPVRCSRRNRSDCVNVDISGDGGQIVAATLASNWYLLEPDDGSTIQSQSLGGVPTAVSISDDGRWLMFGDRDGLVKAVTLATAASSFASEQESVRNLLIVIPTILVAAAVATSVWVRRTASGRRVWDSVYPLVRRGLLLVWRSRISYFMLLPTIILLLIFNYYPAFSGLYHSFTEWKPGIQTVWVGFDQFDKMLGSQFFWVGIKNTLILAGAAFLKLTIPLLVAEFIFHIRWSNLQYYLRTLFIIPLVLPSVVGILLWVNIYDPNIGLLNNTLAALGLQDATRAWLGDRDTALAAIIAIGAPWVSPLALLIFYGGLIGIPQELFDAGKVDGATAWSRFWKIDIPLLMGQIRLLVILTFIGSLQEFQLIFLTTGGGPGSATYTPALELYYQATRFNNFGLASAMGTFLFLIILGGTIINLRTIRSQTEYEA